MSDMTETIVPRSDQINADSLLAGPITIRVTEVVIGGGEQPVTIHYEHDGGKPFRPGKSMRRVLVKAWGADATDYIGRSMTLYTDPTIKFGGMEVGGIRISHLSHIDRTLTMALTETKGRKKPFVVQPLVIEPAPKPGGFVEWLSGYSDRLKAATKLEEIAAIMGSDDKAISIRTRGSEKQKAAMETVEADAKAALGGRGDSPR